MKQANSAYYEGAPVTARGGDILAKCYGYADVSDLAASLPDGAKVLDVGAGYSTLGKEVTDQRADVHWLNVDLAYSEPRLDDYSDPNSVLPSLGSLPADALRLTETLGHRQFDRVFSYYTLPHIILAGRDKGRLAAKNILEVAKPQGLVSVGPRSGLLNLLKTVDTLTLETPKSQQELDAAADFIVDSLALGRFWGWMHKKHNAALAAGHNSIQPQVA